MEFFEIFPIWQLLFYFISDFVMPQRDNCVQKLFSAMKRFGISVMSDCRFDFIHRVSPL